MFSSESPVGVEGGNTAMYSIDDTTGDGVSGSDAACRCQETSTMLLVLQAPVLQTEKNEVANICAVQPP